ncbi:hypothetical protein EL84_21345 [Paenibacillus sp. VT-400]|uniref:hypothetical protein n=1 Tax=Paenibacillus sp. VT-400 TaxID=1495853 RepID=UPI00064959C5|nr:hypothetical protein [Paenibacillus sp. VT-400]KLU54691.1 hypothetical protein EL84_21345 [Paenibacillus sp. VT-400]
MKVKELEEYIRSELMKVDGDELAFIQLTGKEERLIRDKTAYAMYRDGMVVKREHKYIDIVTFQDDNYSDLIEFSLFYTWDLLQEKMYMNKNGIFAKLTKDKTKLANFPIAVNKFMVLCILHPRRDKELELFEKENLFSYPQFFDKFLMNKYDEIPLIGFNRIKNDFYHNILDEAISHFKMEFGVYRATQLNMYFWIIPIIK